MARTLTALATIFLYFQGSTAYLPRFHHGRPRGGFLPPPTLSSSAPLPPDMWMEQRLDHFNDANTQTWRQRYFVTDKHYKPGGPVFLFLGGEGPASPAWMVSGMWIEYAKVYNALCFQIEHRFYGESHPTPDLSVENLQYLSSEQALADTAAFVEFAKVKYNVTENLWISFGGSYSGALSAWLRMKYPHLIAGAVASSAPVLAQFDFKNYYGVVSQSLATTGPGCDEAIQQATASIQSKLQTQEGRDELKKLFNLCDDLDPNNKNNIDTFFESLAETFAGLVQYNKIGNSNITIDTVCAVMTDASIPDPLDRYVKVHERPAKECYDFSYSEMINSMKKTDWESPAAFGMRQWIYQTCTEFGYYQSSDLSDQPFGHSFPVSFVAQQCMDIYGSKFNQSLITSAIKRTNTNYGGLGIKVTKIVFPNGSIDPWHALGIRENLGPDAIAIYINGTAHCANMMPPSKNDPKGLVEARATIQGLIGQWIQQNDN